MLEEQVEFKIVFGKKAGVSAIYDQFDLSGFRYVLENGNDAKEIVSNYIITVD